jgi:hypothetical protein
VSDFSRSSQNALQIVGHFPWVLYCADIVIRSANDVADAPRAVVAWRPHGVCRFSHLPFNPISSIGWI